MENMAFFFNLEKMEAEMLLNCSNLVGLIFLFLNMLVNFADYCNCKHISRFQNRGYTTLDAGCYCRGL